MNSDMPEQRTEQHEEPYEFVADCTHTIPIGEFYTEFDRETFCDDCLAGAVVKWINEAEPEEIARYMNLQRQKVQHGD